MGSTERTPSICLVPWKVLSIQDGHSNCEVCIVMVGRETMYHETGRG